MKTKITTLLMALCLGGVTFAQQNSGSNSIGADSKLLSTTTQGDCTVKRYLVKENSSDNDEFSVKYKINISRLITTYDSNSEELKGLHSFIEQLQQDTLKKITAVNITGFASPDGPLNLNEDLAMDRAQDFRKYINQNYDMSKYSGTTKADVYKWSAISDAVSASAIPNKGAVLSTLNGDLTASAIEKKLKTMPQSWDYMTKNILPQFRCVELCVKYNSWKIVEVRTQNKSRAPQPTVVNKTNYYILIEENSSGMVINSSKTPLDYDNGKFKEKYRVSRHHERLKEKAREGNERLYLYERGRIRR